MYKWYEKMMIYSFLIGRGHMVDIIEKVYKIIFYFKNLIFVVLFKNFI